ncbi:hypothetical protein QB794_002246 [Salmonella enterica]|nr:hypothetical protein [Salmonella enterica]EKS4862818.1 hypothetical protein [Salmonella enterica]EKS4880531.1 hypothetical protein [Salmonella enterica]EKS4884990.1 hypothetical protein [Salmonella enterica]EKS5974646.1 hypothetical protein [Salmonella enterica]
MAKNEQVTATVVAPFMVAGEMAVIGDEVILGSTDAENLLYRGKIKLSGDESDDEEAE